MQISFPPALFPLTSCESTFLSHCLSSPPPLAMSKNQSYGAIAGAGAGLADGWYSAVDGWYCVVAGRITEWVPAANASQSYVQSSGCSSSLLPPSTGCMTDSNLSGTSSASCAVALLLLLAVARVAAMPLWASIPTDLFVVFLYILHLP